MDYKGTNLFFLQEDCLGEFGNEKGTDIYIQSSELLRSMIEKADYRNNDSIKYHMSKNMLPAIAYYMVLQNNNFSKEEAYDLTLKETQKWANVMKKRNKSLGKIPFAYFFFRLLAKGFMKKNFPVEGWETKWVRCDSQEIHMNFSKCIYVDLTTEYGCPELCTVFCKNDMVAFAGYKPQIYFERNGTLAEGAACCDFHFIRGK